MQSTQKDVEGATALFVFVVVDETKNMARAYGTGVGARRGHRFVIAIMLFSVLRHPTCASCVA